MSKNDFSVRLGSFLKALRGALDTPEPVKPAEPPADPIDEFIWSFLLWESTAPKAEHALRRIRAATVDFNELRVSLPGEIRAMLGDRYPLVSERAVRLRAALDDIYRKERAVSLARLRSLTKRESRRALDEIEATPAFVAARVQLVSIGGHAAPLDQRTFDLLRREGVFGDDSLTLRDASHLLARHVKASEALRTHLLLQAWADADGAPTQKRSAPRRVRKQTPRKKQTASTTSRTRRKKTG